MRVLLKYSALKLPITLTPTESCKEIIKNRSRQHEHTSQVSRKIDLPFCPDSSVKTPDASHELDDDIEEPIALAMFSKRTTNDPLFACWFAHSTDIFISSSWGASDRQSKLTERCVNRQDCSYPLWEPGWVGNRSGSRAKTDSTPTTVNGQQ
jgi:hypothetical protein